MERQGGGEEEDIHRDLVQTSEDKLVFLSYEMVTNQINY